MCQMFGCYVILTNGMSLAWWGALLGNELQPAALLLWVHLWDQPYTTYGFLSIVFKFAPPNLGVELQ